ncbi:MAG: hypothetical protein R3190_11880, partial [Thermoanaerobaculia bacterium]|nr:hypothetical protein [Thermoanaerobaculia bacterium]
EIAERDVDEFFMAFPYVKVKITRPGDPDLADDDHGLTVFSHNLMLSADGANLSGGTSPNLALDEVGPDRFSGRIWLDETQEFFDDTYHYDLRFAADLSDPNAPIGPPLPAGGGEPGKAYTAWVAAVHSGELDRIRALMPADMQEMLEEEIEGRSDEEVAEMLEMLTLFTPADAKVVGGSSDGDTAILDVTGTMEGEAVKGEVTMNRVNGTWILVGEAWQ